MHDWRPPTKCPMCGQTVRLKVDGTFMKHPWRTDPICAMSGRAPADLFPPTAFKEK